MPGEEEFPYLAAMERKAVELELEQVFTQPDRQVPSGLQHATDALARRNGWPDDESLDFTVHGAPAADGTIWCMLRCSGCGSVSAMVTWDVWELLLACDRHYRNVHRGEEDR